MEWKLVAQGLNLIGCIIYHTTAAIISLPWVALYYVGLRKRSGAGDPDGSVVFYEGYVEHTRRVPKHNHFRYAVRYAVLDLERPPSWFSSQAKDHLTPDQARQFAGTQGRVRLLTDPQTAGYVQNPISVYYCYGPGDDGQLEKCIAEVTNTPWGERVSFVFEPQGQRVAKALHVSPFMDMHNTWLLEAPEPGASLKLVVNCDHPQHGRYFDAALVAARAPLQAHVSEEAGLRAALRYAFMPHRVALLIYWQAVRLIAMGVPLYMPPSKRYQQAMVSDEQGASSSSTNGEARNGVQNGLTVHGKAATANARAGKAASCGREAHEWEQGQPGWCPVRAGAHTHPRNKLDGKHFVWRDAPGWPWR